MYVCECECVCECVYVCMLSHFRGDFVVEGAANLSSPSAEAQWHLEAYLAWLDYCEQTVVSSSKVGLYSTTHTHQCAY